MGELSRRSLARLGLAAALQPGFARAADVPVLPAYPAVTPGRALAFPADHGAHPDYRTEWWYLTGWLRTAQGGDLGFQATFFRTRPAVDQRNPSAFSARQVIFAHAALSDPRTGRLAHDQRMARAGFGLAQARVGDADVRLDGWRLWRTADGAFHVHVDGEALALDLDFAPTQAPLAQGQGGFSRKGPAAAQASYYYSLPHLKVAGSVRRVGRSAAVTGEAWMDREWSSAILGGGAVGWDWTGLNLDDGGALTAFQVRDGRGRALWVGGSWRDAMGGVVRLAPGDVSFQPLRRWRSPRTGAAYPVEQALAVRTPQGVRRLHLKPLFDDQELDSRAAGGPVYWEGAVTTAGGRGYLELTGYVQPLKL
ncbi:carotenoid 1,2-hydratase [Phenylobacterium sp.]|uniref:lipocalin-like domain-containing protein n=1 Tax=Phenylobacterium sp. TaxID=1871053 RepID=UPI002F411FA1